MRRSFLTIDVNFTEYQKIDREKRFLWHSDQRTFPVHQLPTSEKMERLPVVFYCGAINSLRVFHLLRLVPRDEGIELQLA
ncbi:hypothetical protein NIE88_10235 [Sporolactobacillus shoreicorticis]|uniref:hypothetical protein n=1 Tax=Sporolactobacillus shoreicorticis TaxID=1923877 RepID=UPI002097D3C9|nr:hypothetical protein [Sporolactobacillus shoreicorticis]MCO7126152.1 hypothetical protein [Sporolactobacillus shoreicorticis]